MENNQYPSIPEYIPNEHFTKLEFYCSSLVAQLEEKHPTQIEHLDLIRFDKPKFVEYDQTGG